MLYGEPTLSNISSFQEQVEYLNLRKLLCNKSFEEKINTLLKLKGAENLHGWFDATSPLINDTYSFAEIENWLIQLGFEDIYVISISTNHHVIAKK